MMKVSALAFLLWCSITLTNSQNSSLVEANLDVLTVLPYVVPGLFFQPSHSDGPALYLAIKLAADILNNRTDILDGYKLNLLRENGGCNIPFRALDGLVRGLSLGKEDPPIVGMIGPACSTSSTTAAAFNGRKEVSLLNIYSGGTNETSNRTKYPFSFGILDSVDVIAETLVALIRDNSWKNISVFHEESRLYFSSLSRAFKKKLTEYNEELHNEDQHEVDFELRDVQSNNPLPVTSVRNMNRIVIFMVTEDLLKQMICVLHHAGIKFPNYLFILAGLEAFNPSNVTIPQNKICTDGEITKILATSVLIDYQLEASDNGTKYSGESLISFKILYKQRIDDMNVGKKLKIKPSREAAMYFDALWSLALALNNSMDRVNLTTYQFFGHQNSTKIIRSELMMIDYEGLSGRIRFNNITGRVEQNVSISLIVDNSEMKIAYYTKITNNITIVRQDNYNNIFISDQFQLKVKTIPQVLTYLILIFAAIAFFMTAAIHILIFVYRKRKPVKASNIELNWLAFISCYVFVVVMLLNILIHGFSDKMSATSTCTLQHVFDISLSVGLTLLLGTASLRTWRLYRIFIHMLNPGKFLSNRALMVALGGVVLSDLILVVPAIFTSPYEPEFKYITSEQNTEAGLTRIMVCNRKNYIVWFFCSLAVSIMLMAILLVLTIQTRKITRKHFKTKWTLCQLYSLTIVLPFFLGLYLVFSFKLTYGNIIARFLIYSVLVLSLLFISNLMLVLPLLQVFRESRLISRKWPHKRKPSIVYSVSIKRLQ